MSVLPTVEPQLYTEADLEQVDEVLELAARRGYTAGVLVLRRALEAQRALLDTAGQFQYLVPPRKDRAPVTERRRPRAVMAAENAAVPDCEHSDTLRGPCTRKAHPDKPKAHSYAREVVTRRAARPVPGANFSAAS